MGIEWLAHPGKEDALREYERVVFARQPLHRGLIRLPLASDAAAVATIHVLVRMVPTALTLDPNLPCLLMCRAVSLILEHGNCDASCYAYAELATFIGPSLATTGLAFGWRSSPTNSSNDWDSGVSRPGRIMLADSSAWRGAVTSGLLVLCSAERFEAANQGWRSYSCRLRLLPPNTNLLAAADPLSEVQREAENGLAFVRKSASTLQSM